MLRHLGLNDFKEVWVVSIRGAVKLTSMFVPLMEG